MTEISPSTIGLSENEYSHVALVGSGSYAAVFRALHIPSSQYIAIKAFNRQTVTEKAFQREIKYHKLMCHPFIIKVYGSETNKNYHLMFMEYVDSISMIDRINEMCGFSEPEAQRLIIQLALTVKFMHLKKNICHRDLKLDNILIDRYGNLRLIDFGFCNKFVIDDDGEENEHEEDNNDENEDENYKANSKKENIHNKSNMSDKNNSDSSSGGSCSSRKVLLKTHCGSFPYCAPEVFQEGDLTEKVDIWSLGIILYAFIGAELPFEDENVMNLIRKIRTTEPEYGEEFSDLAIDLLKKMLKKDPESRISIEEVMEHPFLTSSKYYDVLTELEVNFDIEKMTDGMDIFEQIMLFKGYKETLNKMIQESLFELMKGPHLFTHRSHNNYNINCNNFNNGNNSCTDKNNNMGNDDKNVDSNNGNGYNSNICSCALSNFSISNVSEANVVTSLAFSKSSKSQETLDVMNPLCLPRKNLNIYRAPTNRYSAAISSKPVLIRSTTGANINCNGNSGATTITKAATTMTTTTNAKANISTGIGGAAMMSNIGANCTGNGLKSLGNLGKPQFETLSPLKPSIQIPVIAKTGRRNLSRMSPLKKF